MKKSKIRKISKKFGKTAIARLYSGKILYLEDFKNLIKKAGVKQGDTLLMHSEIFNLGIPLLPPKEYLNTLFLAIKETIGQAGTLIVPTYTYSFCKGKIYNPKTSASKMGALNEFIRKNIATHRTLDANFSHAILGKKSLKLMQASNIDTFGKTGFFSAFKALNGKILLLGNEKIGGTFFHHIEKMANVSYRPSKIKGFDGCCL